MHDPPPARDAPNPAAHPTPTHPRDRAWVEIDSAAILHNMNRVRQSVGPDVMLIPMVKANGYGLGVERVVQALTPARPFGYGVATVAEGLELRSIGVREPVMVFSPAVPDTLAPAVAGGLIPTISDRAGLAALRDAAASVAPGVEAAFQVEIDTGMGRAGFTLQDTGTGWWKDILRATESGLKLFGVFTHLHSADEPDISSARRQIERFDDFVRGADGIGPDTLLHCANSAGALRLAPGTANAVRPGIYLYGGAAGRPADPPEPVAALRARVVLVRDVVPGTTLGYGATYRAREREHWATVGIGYGDGLPRVLGNRGGGIVRGRRVPIVGRISMDMTVVRTSGDVSVGDTVTFVGRDGDAELTLDEVAQRAGTIGYEILTGLSPRLPRVAGLS
ncbi:MAG: alanine racemase [Gemmatimonadetes bacterium]|nr:alanine racemase [Gemmatimonadota bacterium]